MYTLYQILSALLFYPLLPVLLLYVLITGNHREGIRQRLALYPPLPKKKKGGRIWLHAASVGEVQAASLLIDELRERVPESEIVLTTMTIHGREFGKEQLEGVTCLLLPLDIPGIVGRAVRRIDPDIYLCMETELWPVQLRCVTDYGIPVLLINGRMSTRTVDTYRKYARLFRPVLENFHRLCLISETDKERFCAVGVAPDSVEVTGNIKFDRRHRDDSGDVCNRYRGLLGVTEKSEIFIAGSTHTGEEELLYPLFEKMSDNRDMVWVVAPRHLNRVEKNLAFFADKGVQVDLFSALKQGRARRHKVVVVDTFGDLFNLYSVGTYNFCGGSLVEKRGHNIMEPALWGKPVLYGPSMDDFLDAQELLEEGGGGFLVESAEEIWEQICFFQENPSAYDAACKGAAATATAQQGAAARQAEVVVEYLHSGS